MGEGAGFLVLEAATRGGRRRRPPTPRCSATAPRPTPPHGPAARRRSGGGPGRDPGPGRCRVRPVTSTTSTPTPARPRSATWPRRARWPGPRSSSHGRAGQRHEGPDRPSPRRHRCDRGGDVRPRHPRRAGRPAPPISRLPDDEIAALLPGLLRTAPSGRLPTSAVDVLWLRRSQRGAGLRPTLRLIISRVLPSSTPLAQ